MELIRVFGELGRHDAGIAGGKGASLGEMTQAGIPVPPGFVVLSSAFERFLEETDLNVEIDSILHGVDTKAMHTTEYASETIQKLILEAKMPEDIALLVNTSFASLNTPFVAVRSSATAEDSASAAWAGQLDSFLNTTGATLLENVQRCWASLFTPRQSSIDLNKDSTILKYQLRWWCRKWWRVKSLALPSQCIRSPKTETSSSSKRVLVSVKPLSPDKSLPIAMSWGRVHERLLIST
ncbi:MAG: hypothetical protein K9M10_02160 [Candidatus Pacebacteria bacterium]|nr:hypothetical protein [Candidatus Paceibacterota bacterium]MCF7857267.1 hypothetical protein [Candidatus Paceibacterota bacterium]